MQDKTKTKKTLMDELNALRQKLLNFEIRETQCRNTEDALDKSETRYRTIVESIEEGYYELDRAGNFTFFNDRVCEILGYGRDELVGMNYRRIVDDYNAKKSFEAFNKVYTTGKSTDLFDYEITRKDGTKRNLELSISLTRNPQSDLSVFFGIARDITDRKKAEGALQEAHDKLEARVKQRTSKLIETNEKLKREIKDRKLVQEALAESEEKYRLVVENANEAILIAQDGLLKFVNSKTEEITGYSAQAMISRPFIDFIYHDDRELVLQRFQRRLLGEPLPEIYPFRVVDSEGNLKWVEINVVTVNWNGRPATLNFIADITSRKKMEDEAIKIEKLESIGLLAGGIAHDFNNILTAILGNISLARNDLKPEHTAFDRLAEAEKACLRAQSLTQQLLTFSKGGSPVKKIGDIAKILKECCVFSLRGSNVSCRFAVPDDLWPVEIDEGQISEVVSNLIINADHAMPRGGAICVAAANVVVASAEGIPLPDGDYVKISVKDHGSGMPKDYLQKIFDPYFTTKHKGSGLGLATSHSIVKNHGGLITVESELGSGSVFHIYLPASPRTQRPLENQEEEPLSGKGKVLFMDDEDLIRDLAYEILSLLGYEVVLVRDGEEAIVCYKEAQESSAPFDAVIMDLTVPGGMGGYEAMNVLRKIDPDVRGIVSSGYSTDPIMADYRKYGFKGIVPKPYTVKDLGAILHKVMEE
jgi:two-component system, cell cycle sensor histidine kinase and response regulator CckA